MLQYTEHPLVDVGAAAIAAFSQKRGPSEVTVEDLERLAAYLEEQYQRPYLRGYLTCIFPNSAYVNPTSGPEKKRAFLDAHLYSFRDAPPREGEPCGICARPASTRGFRQHVPMVTGEEVLNFFPNGQPGLPLCAGCMISIAAVPLGALRCGGRALIVHADDPDLTYRFAQTHVQRNRQLLQLEDLTDEAKFPDAKQPRTRLIERLQEWAAAEATRSHQAGRRRLPPTSMTAYHFTNSGQGPDIDIYHLPAPVLSFFIDAEADIYRNTWHAIRSAGWRIEKDGTDGSARRNFLYDDVFRLPAEWGRFVRTYFLRRAYWAAPKDDPRGSYSVARDRELISWPLTELFLKGITAMEQHRVTAIRDFGDRVADYIAERDASFWREFHLAKTYGGLRVRLIKASQTEQKAGRPPLIGFDDFITIFEYGEDLARPDWRLARDLVLIRVIEQLHQRDWFGKHPDALEIETPDEEPAENIPVAAA